MRSRPDILVLGSGGVLGEAWLSGVLGGIEDGAGLELSRCEYFVGTSAGAIVAARLAAGSAIERPAASARREDGSGSGRAAEPPMPDTPPTGPRPARPLAAVQQGLAWASVLGPPLAIMGLAVGRPAGALARGMALRAMPRPSAGLDQVRAGIDDLGARFDGRLRVVAVARASGRRTVFGQPRGPAASVADAVAASCAVPWLFAPVVIGGVEYVDGGVWSPTNVDAAPAGRGSQVLCLSPTARLADASPLAAIAGRASSAITAIETSSLRGRGAKVTVIAPDRASAAAIGRDLMDSSRRGAVLAAGHAQGLTLAQREDR